MKKYVKPELIESDLRLEGVYASSGDEGDEGFGEDSTCGKPGHHWNSGRGDGSNKPHPGHGQENGNGWGNWKHPNNHF